MVRGVSEIAFKLFKKSDGEKSILGAPASLPDLARDVYEKKETNERSEQLLDGTLKQEPKERVVKEPEVKPHFFEKSSLTSKPLPEPQQQPVQQQVQPQFVQPVQHVPIQPVIQPVQMPQYIQYPQYQPYLQHPYPQYPPSYPALPQYPVSPGYFHDVEHKFMQGDHQLVRDHLSQGAINKMKEFHVNPELPRDQYLKRSVLSTLGDLKQLEMSWKQTRAALEDMEAECVRKEREIEMKAQELELFMDHLVSHKLVRKSIDREQWFKTADGVLLASVRDLKLALPSMPDWVFAHHVSVHRNDFANWIGQVFEDVLLEKKVRKALSKSALYDVLNLVV